MNQTKAPKKTPSPLDQSNGVNKADNPTQQFLSMALDMTWRLALVVVIPIVIGSTIDKHLKTKYTFVILGIFFAVLGAVVITYRSYKIAGQINVKPKESK